MTNNQRISRVGILSLFVIGYLLFGCVSEARADIVVFKTGRTMSVQAYRVDGDHAQLVLREGGEIAFPLSMVARVDPDEVPYPVPFDSQAGREDAPVPLAQDRPVQLIPDEVLAARPFADLIATVAADQNVDARLVHAVIETESNYQARARSPKGAQGLMQLMPGTAKDLKVNPFDVNQNVDGGVRHLKGLLNNYGGDVTLSLAAYNAGTGAVARHDGVPPYRETRDYVKKITKLYGTEPRPAVRDTSIRATRDPQGRVVFTND